MKKLSIILAMMLAMTTFAGCEKEDEKSETKKETKVEDKADKKSDKKAEEDSPESIVEAFLDDAFSQSLGDYEDYFTEDADAEDDFDSFKDMDFIGDDVDALTEMFGEDLGEDMIDSIYDTFEYEVEDVEVDGDEAEVTITLKSPDFENLEIDEEEMMAEVMGIDLETATEDELLEWLEDNGLDENSTEEDIMEVIGEDLVDYIIDVMKDADKVEEESVFTVVKNDDGEWRISAID